MDAVDASTVRSCVTREVLQKILDESTVEVLSQSLIGQAIALLSISEKILVIVNHLKIGDGESSTPGWCHFRVKFHAAPFPDGDDLVVRESFAARETELCVDLRKHLTVFGPFFKGQLLRSVSVDCSVSRTEICWLR